MSGWSVLMVMKAIKTQHQGPSALCQLHADYTQDQPAQLVVVAHLCQMTEHCFTKKRGHFNIKSKNKTKKPPFPQTL